MSQHDTEGTRPEVTILKLDADGREIIRYTGRLLERSANAIRLEATFELDDVTTLHFTFRRGDRLVETFYTDRWYNVFAVYDGRDGALNGWYCNIGRPARIDGDTVSQQDLALDLWVSPDGACRWLDEDEFAALSLTPAERTAVAAARAHLLRLARQGALPR